MLKKSEILDVLMEFGMPILDCARVLDTKENLKAVMTDILEKDYTEQTEIPLNHALLSGGNGNTTFPSPLNKKICPGCGALIYTPPGRICSICGYENAVEKEG